MNTADAVLDTLFRPFDEGALALPKDALFLRAREGIALREHRIPELICGQTFKSDADALVRAGFSVENNELERQFSMTLVLPPRQRDEARALLARAVHATRPGGRVVACAANDAGAKSHERDLETLTGSVAVLSKNKCRVFWSQALTVERRSAMVDDWLALDTPRSICEGRYMSRPGIFAWDRVDSASALLATHLPADLAGSAADLGAGFGYLSMELLSRCNGIERIDLYEAEQRALDLARINLKQCTSKAKTEFVWHDVTSGLPRRYDVIVTNPPFHALGNADRPDIGRRFIAVAAQALNPRGRLWLVANRHLPYESMLDANFGTARIVAQSQGFKIIEAIKSGATR